MDFPQIRNESLKEVAKEYDWKRLARVYDSEIQNITMKVNL